MTLRRPEAAEARRHRFSGPSDICLALNYYRRESLRGAQIHGRHSRDLPAGIHGCLVIPLPLAEVYREVFGAPA
jgi:hypothetical protein